ncbi:MAG: dihydrodipicolinate synthase family protein [Dongiaceae bacterium]
MKIPTFKGVLSVTCTPFDKAGEVDEKAWGRHLDFLIENRVHAIIPHGTTGEYYAQSMAERRRGLEFVAGHIGKKLPLYAGTNSARPAEAVELSNLAKDLGYQALMLAAPFYSLPSSGELAEHFRFIARNTDLPIILYNFPARTGVDMNKEFIESVTDIKAVCAIKESSGSFARMLEHIVFFDDRLQRIAGADDQAVDAFLWGAKSWIAGASNCLPGEHVALYEVCVEKQDFVRGKRLMQALLPLLFLLENGGKYIQYVKYGCELAGSPVGDPRQPLLPLTAEEKAKFKKLWTELKSSLGKKLAA